MIRGRRVTFAGFGDRPRDDPNYIRVDLLEWNEIEIGGTEGGLEAAAIFEDVFAGVPFHEAEIEDFFGFKGAHAAGASAETVDQPGELEKRGKFDYLQTTSLARAPRRGDAGGSRLRRYRLARATPLQ